MFKVNINDCINLSMMPRDIMDTRQWLASGKDHFYQGVNVLEGASI
jgi:hypothetical protein